METRASVKGQVVIPAKIRRRLGIEPGTPMAITVDEQRRRIILTPITRAHLHALRGKFRGKGLLKALRTEKKRERAL